MLKVLEGRAYRLQHPWVGIVNRSQADINKNVDMIIARRKESEYFETSPEYGHLAHKMGSEYLAKLLSQVLIPFFIIFYVHLLLVSPPYILVVANKKKYSSCLAQLIVFSYVIFLFFSTWRGLSGSGYQVSLP